MNYKKLYRAFLYAFISLGISCSAVITQSCATAKSIRMIIPADTIVTNDREQGAEIEFHFQRGEVHNHPLMALWIEDTSGNYLQTLYVAESIAKGVYGHGDKSSGKWLPGNLRRPASLPVWAFSRNIREDDGYYIPSMANPMPDAVTGATPSGDFVILSKLSANMPPDFDVYFEINQSWDWNEYWTNDKYPENENYKTSCQPALVYKARINTQLSGEETYLSLIGHSHYAGENGEIFSDLSTITTAKGITKSVWVKVR